MGVYTSATINESWYKSFSKSFRYSSTSNITSGHTISSDIFGYAFSNNKRYLATVCSFFDCISSNFSCFDVGIISFCLCVGVKAIISSLLLRRERFFMNKLPCCKTIKINHTFYVYCNIRS